jgi:hypothetical protein
MAENELVSIVNEELKTHVKNRLFSRSELSATLDNEALLSPNYTNLEDEYKFGKLELSVSEVLKISSILV